MNQIEYLTARIVSTLSPMEYMQAMKQNPEKYLIVDVRNAPASTKKTKIVGALDIPLQELAEKAQTLDHDKIIIVYCWDVWCNMAAHASLTLLKQGFQVKELVGGIAAWNEMNFPTQPCE